MCFLNMRKLCSDFASSVKVHGIESFIWYIYKSLLSLFLREHVLLLRSKCLENSLSYNAEEGDKKRISSWRITFHSLYITDRAVDGKCSNGNPSSVSLCRWFPKNYRPEFSGFFGRLSALFAFRNDLVEKDVFVLRSAI